MAKFEKNGFRDQDLARIKASQETDFYNGVSSILSKALQLGTYNEYAGDPNYAGKDISNILAVTREDVMRVYHKYIKNKPAIITSFVPKSKPGLILAGSSKADVVESRLLLVPKSNLKNPSIRILLKHRAKKTAPSRPWVINLTCRSPIFGRTKPVTV
jgi:hypothetical protein